MLSKADYSITEAIRLFNQFSVDVAFIVPTAVGLGKAIMDATAPLRSYLKSKAIHNYDGQLQGPEGKRKIPAFLVTADDLLETEASLYRPKAKGREGDPRIWFSGLPSYASPNNLLAVVAFGDALYVINLSNERVRESARSEGTPLGKILREIGIANGSVAVELLSKVKAIAARGWIQSVTRGDTGVGRTLEHLLGIPINSSRAPDYKGIEIKAKRLRGLRTSTRSSLFAQVPDWSISKLKSSADVLESYGYSRGEEKRLYCTVSSSGPNSQGLMLKVDEARDLLHEVYERDEMYIDVVSWRFDVLRGRLLSKHNETFWVGAESEMRRGVEFFQYKKVLHTRIPLVSNFHTLCHEGIVTVDHLIKKGGGRGVQEKGPLFKISQSHLDLLFPPPISFDLIAH